MQHERLFLFMHRVVTKKSASANAQNSRMEDCEGETTSNPPHDDWIWLSLLSWNSICQSSIECCSFKAHTACCWENNGCEDIMLHFLNTFGILPFWFTICGGHGLGRIAWHVGVENPYIEKCVLTSVPKTMSVDVKANIWVSVCWTMSERLISKGLKKWLSSNIVVSFCEQSCRDITDLIVADSRDATQMIYHGMDHWEGRPTIAWTRYVTEVQTIGNSPLCVFSHRQNCEPWWRPFLLS